MTNNLPDHQTAFESIKRLDENGKEYWSSRDLAKVLEYDNYRNFQRVIEKAETACNLSGNATSDHFVEADDMIRIGKGGLREVDAIFLSRYACYLIVQNADSDKPMVALGQSYFAFQTRRQELHDQLLEDKMRVQLRQEMKTHNKKLADTAHNAGVIEPIDYAIFTNYGYKGLYNGMGKKEIQDYKGLKKGQEILDHMGSTELAANLFRATQAEEKIRRESIMGKNNANVAHYEVGKRVRKAMQEISGTVPEDLPVAENIKYVERRIAKELPSGEEG